MTSAKWTTITVVFAALLLALGVVPTYYQLQYRFGFEVDDEALPTLVLGSVLQSLSVPAATVGIATLLALLAARLLSGTRVPPAEASGDDLGYDLERDPA